MPAPSAGEIAVIGLGRSGVAATRLLLSRGYAVYVCDDGTSSQLDATASQPALAAASVQTGGHDAERIARAALVVASPGVPPDAAAMISAREAARTVVSEIEVALRLAPALQYVAVTGTNGKTTTTALIGHIFRTLGLNAPDAGNIGTPLSEISCTPVPPDWVSLELSSFQLHDTPSVAPTVGVLTNLSPDHLDRYSSVDAYYGDKAMLFRNATTDSRWVVNADDAASVTIVRDVAGEKLRFSLHGEAAGYYDRARGNLIVFGAPLVARSRLHLLGDHNVANALAASLAVMSADEQFRLVDARNEIARALESFEAMPNRLEVVGEWDGVEWINDSKATNVASTLVAVDGMTRPTVLLLGGRHKGEPYTALTAAIRQHVKHVVAFGEAAPFVERDLSGSTALSRIAGSFEEVVAAARSLAAPGDAVLLSPACSSYDMFNNYVERGARFRDLAKGSHG
ncbi:MAG: UDP-N-acetylmuramoyl-L-alanine--D-glutamate ligase [Gemmatimonadaceae bacterium]